MRNLVFITVYLFSVLSYSQDLEVAAKKYQQWDELHPEIAYYDYTYIDNAVKNTFIPSNVSIDEIGKYLTIKSRNDIEKFRAVYLWILANYTYDINTSVGISRDMEYKSFERKTGVCADYTMTFSHICRTLGLEVYDVTGYEYVTNFGADGANHAWNIINIDGVYVPVDVTWKEFAQNPHLFEIRHNTTIVYDIYGKFIHNGITGGESKIYSNVRLVESVEDTKEYEIYNLVKEYINVFTHNPKTFKTFVNVNKKEFIEYSQKYRNNSISYTPKTYSTKDYSKIEIPSMFKEGFVYYNHNYEKYHKELCEYILSYYEYLGYPKKGKNVIKNSFRKVNKKTVKNSVNTYTLWYKNNINEFKNFSK